jgi:hypothetical protein
MINSSLCVDVRIDRNIRWLTARLISARLIKNLQFNISLHKVVNEPLIALGIPICVIMLNTD